MNYSIEGMRRDYDFSKGVRGNFYREGAELRLPIYLDANLPARLQRAAKRTADKSQSVSRRKRK